jgi:hypothetical protein
LPKLYVAAGMLAKENRESNFNHLIGDSKMINYISN